MISRASSTPPRAAGLTYDVEVRSRHLLVAQAVGAALQRRDVSARVMPWDEAGDAQQEIGGDVLLLLDELDSRAAVDTLRALVSSSRVPVLVLAGKPAGAAWGGMLDAGAAEVLPSSASLDTVEHVLGRVVAGEPIMPSEVRVALLRRWHEWLAEEKVVEERLWSLSPRESSVLGMLAEGLHVVDIAERLGVSESTVRSHVKALRRKLRVESQLAAVAVARRFAAGPSDDEDGPPVPQPRDRPR